MLAVAVVVLRAGESVPVDLVEVVLVLQQAPVLVFLVQQTLAVAVAVRA
jgi:hypothetical protein